MFGIIVTQPTIIKYSISSTNGYSLLYAGKSGSSSAIYKINTNNVSYKVMPGTYYFAVLSEDGSYSSTSTYTANFVEVGSMSGDSAVTLIGISENAGACAILTEAYEPAAVHYHSSTKPAMNVSSRPALLLTFHDDSDFYRIHCTGSGAYSENTLWEDLNYVTVLIDPDTGKLIDIAEYNYFYDFAPVGSNSITWTRSYIMKFYDNL